jgi:segregation and condensation protein A
MDERQPADGDLDGGGPGTPAPAGQTSGAGPSLSGVPYRVRLELFEGPLDLLLHLVKKNEVDVADIPIAAVTEQYLGYLDLMRDLNLDIAGEYLVMAATLTLIKSRMLLPSPEADGEEEADPRADLVRQLLEYQRYREAAQGLGARPLLRRDVFTREPGAEGIEPEPDARPAVRVTIWQLMEAFRGVLRRARPDPVHEVQAEAVSLPDRIRGILWSLRVARTLSFDSLFDESATRGFVIVTFLALLELIKMGAVEAVQEEVLGPVLIVLAVEDVDSVTIGLTDEYGGGPGPAGERPNE